MKKLLDEVKEIKPCPFCGGKAYETERGEYGEYVYIACGKCDAKSPSFCITDYRPKTAAKKAIKAWNKRK